MRSWEGPAKREAVWETLVRSSVVAITVEPQRGGGACRPDPKSVLRRQDKKAVLLPVPLRGHSALKCTSLLQMLHCTTLPSAPIGFGVGNFPSPVVRDTPFAFPLPKKTSSISASVMSARKEQREFLIAEPPLGRASVAVDSAVGGLPCVVGWVAAVGPLVPAGPCHLQHWTRRWGPKLQSRPCRHSPVPMGLAPAEAAP